MSTSSAWSYTSIATHWKRTGFDAWAHVSTYASPVEIACDYEAKAIRMTDSKGQEFTSRQVIYTEASGIEPGDMILIGSHSGDPVSAKAQEVRSVLRTADTFDGLTDDFEVCT